MLNRKYKSIKLQLSLLLITIGTVALFLNKATFSEFNTLAICIFGAYSSANVIQKKIIGDASNDKKEI